MERNEFFLPCGSPLSFCGGDHCRPGPCGKRIQSVNLRLPKGQIWHSRDGQHERHTRDALFEDKYKEYSRSKVRRELEKLKRRGPVIQGSRLCDEILYLSRRLRLKIKNRPQPNKPVTDRDFGIGFWPACRKLFANVAGASPAFSIVGCWEYFSRVLTIPDSLRSCLFQIPYWFPLLPPPATPFDQSPPSYA